MIRTSYDSAADALFVWFAPEGAKSSDTKEITPGILFDFDAGGHVIGIEVLDVSARVAEQSKAAA